MKNYLPKVQIFLSVIFFAVCSSGVFYIYEKTLANDDAAAALQLQVADADAAKEEVRTLNDSIKAIDAEKSALESHFVKSSNVVPFLDSVEGIAKAAGVKLEVTSVELAPEHDTLLVEMSASGSFVLVYKFMQLLENSPYELKFTSVYLERGTPLDSKDAKTPEWNAKFKIKVLSFIP